MKTLSKIALGVILCLPLLSVEASAERMRDRVKPQRDNCYAVEYVPRTVEHNTRGRLVRREYTSVQGDYVDGGEIRLKRNPAVYERRTRIVEEEHYTMIPSRCAPRDR